MSHMLHIDVQGDSGTPVVLLHGMPTQPEHTAPLARELSGSHCTLVVHLPGYGNSPPLPAPYSVDRCRELIEEALAAQGVHEATLVGFSGGAWHAIGLALRGKLRVQKLVLLAGLAGFDPEHQAAFRGFADALRSGQDLRPVAPQQFLAADFAAAHPDAVAGVTSWIDAIAPADLAAELDAAAEAPDQRPCLGELAMPVLCRAGELDAAVPTQASRAIAESVQKGTLQIVPGVAHALLYEDFEATAAAVREFVG